MYYLDKVSDAIKDPVRRQLAAKLSVLDELIANVTQALDEKGAYLERAYVCVDSTRLALRKFNLGETGC